MEAVVKPQGPMIGTDELNLFDPSLSSDCA